MAAGYTRDPVIVDRPERLRSGCGAVAGRGAVWDRRLVRRTLVVLVLVPACWGNVATEYPPGLEPLEDNTAPEPGAVDTLVYVSAHSDEFGYDWAHGRGWVAAPMQVVWTALQDSEVIVSWRRTSSHLMTPTPDPAYDLRFTMHYYVDDIINVEWDEDWRYGVVDGSPEEPALAMVRYQKVFGTTFIDLIEGSIQIYPKDAQTTEIEFVEHVDATMAGTREIEISMEDRFASIVARSHGQPLPPR
jgi:hypothetical protein